jgi:hypothetical protein
LRRRERQEEAAKKPQPGKDAAEVVTDGGEEDVGGIAGATLEVASPEMTFRLQVPMMGSMAERRRSSRLMTPKTPRLWPEMKTRASFAHRVRDIPCRHRRVGSCSR